MGEVWAATHTITGRRFALKFLKGQASLSLEMRQRFFREARAANLVEHPSVVNVLDVFALDGGVPVMVMDLLVGETLTAKLERDHVLPQSEAAAIMSPVVEAASAAHARGIVHRDLKPDNIFLEARRAGPPTVKVLDFGIAKLTALEGDAAESGVLTMSGAFLGTPRYMAPEQCYGEAEIDQRADIWALGAILYECLSGHRPVEGANLGQVVTNMLKDEIMPVEKRSPGLDAELARLIGQMLAHKRDDRPSDLSAVQQTLARVATERAPGSVSREPSPVGASKKVQALPSDSIVGESLGLPNAKRALPSPRLRIALFAGLALGVGAVGWSLVRSARHPVADLGSPPPSTPAGTAPAAPAPSSRELPRIPPEAPTSHDAPRPIAEPAHQKRSRGPLGASDPHDPTSPRRPRAPVDATNPAESTANAASAEPSPPPKHNRPHKGLVEEVPF
jgi:serine/threonine-protein kinase